jgi:hypothetical protein
MSRRFIIYEDSKGRRGNASMDETNKIIVET